MDTATWLARSREVAGNIMHVPQKRARGVLESCEKRLCRALDTVVNRSHEVKPFVRWSTRPPADARGELVCVVDRRHFYAFEYLGRNPDRIKFSRLIELAEAT